ncbi:hypothetical protein D3C76_1749300 [compost metagenome]
MVEYVDQQSPALVGRARSQGVQHFRNHADRDLVHGHALELLAKATEVHRIQPESALGQFAGWQDVALVDVEKAGERF